MHENSEKKVAKLSGRFLEGKSRANIITITMNWILAEVSSPLTSVLNLLNIRVFFFISAKFQCEKISENETVNN